MDGETTALDEDTLDYGYVLHRTDGGWWHLHVGRSAWWSYHCDLLGRRTNILLCVQWLAPWAVRRSPQFYLTLDGEGVGTPGPVDTGWGDRPADPEWGDGGRFQREVIPLLFDSPAFQRAAWELVDRQRHLRVVAAGKLVRAEAGDAPGGVT